jgi:hypothetical protein
MCTINTTSRGFGHNAADITRRKEISATRFCSIDEPHINGVLRRMWIIVFRYKHVGIRIVSRRHNIMDASKEKIKSRDLMEINLGLEGRYTRLTDRRSSESRSIGWEPSLLCLWFSVSQDNGLCLIIKTIPDSLAGDKPFFRWNPKLGSIRFRSRFRLKADCIGLDGTDRTVNVKGSIRTKVT